MIILSTNKMNLMDEGVISRMSKKIEFRLPTLENIPKICKIHLVKASNEAIKQKYTSFFENEQDTLSTIFSKLHELKAS